MKAVLSLIILLGGGILLAGDYKSDCGRQTFSGQEFGYCIWNDSESQSRDVLYVFHGAGGDEFAWQYFSGTLDGIWNAEKFNKPSVVAVSFGPKWALIPQNKSSKSGILDIFIQKIMPWAENEKLGFTVNKRQALGLSMGAFNTSQLILNYPQLFNKAVLACPFLMDISPYATSDEIAAYLRRTHALMTPGHLRDILGYLKQIYVNTVEWRLGNPFNLIRKANSSTFPKVFVSCGSTDELGVFTGAQDFTRLGLKRGLDMSFHPVEGGHCSADQVGIARFLMN